MQFKDGTIHQNKAYIKRQLEIEQEKRESRERFDQSVKKLGTEYQRLEDLANLTVFTIDARSYVEMHERTLHEYSPRLVITSDSDHKVISPSRTIYKSARAGLAELCEKLGADAIVDVRPGPDYLMGTALIPKNNPEKSGTLEKVTNTL
jgi:hypothetical protein